MLTEKAVVVVSETRLPGDDLDVQVAENGSWTVVTVGGELDISTAPGLEELLEQRIGPADRPSVALDMSGLRFCDSSGLGLLVRLWKRLQGKEGRLVLVSPPDHLCALLKRTGLDRLFVFGDSVPVDP